MSSIEEHCGGHSFGLREARTAALIAAAAALLPLSAAALEPRASAQVTISGTFGIRESDAATGPNQTVSVSAAVPRGSAAATAGTNGAVSLLATSDGIGIGHNVGAGGGFRLSYEALNIPEGVALAGQLLGSVSGSGVVRTVPFVKPSIAIASYTYSFRASGNGDSSANIGGMQWVGEGGLITVNPLGNGVEGTLTANWGVTVQLSPEFSPTGTARTFLPTADDWLAWGAADPTISVVQLAQLEAVDNLFDGVLTDIEQGLRAVGLPRLGISPLGLTAGTIGMALDVAYDFNAENRIALTVAGGRSGVLLASVTTGSATTLLGLEARSEVGASGIAASDAVLADALAFTGSPDMFALFDRFEVAWDTPYDLTNARLMFQGVGSVPIVRSSAPFRVMEPATDLLIALALCVIALIARRTNSSWARR